MQTRSLGLTHIGTMPDPKPIAEMTSKSAPLPHSGAHPTEPVKPSDTQINEAIKTANSALKSISSSLEFSKDKLSGKDVIRVIDTSSKEVIRQFPTEEMLSVSRMIDQFKGVLIHQKA